MRGKDPKKAKQPKCKMLIFSQAGYGKTWFSTLFPKNYLIDAEGGSSLPHYVARLKEVGATYLGPEDGASDPAIILEEFKSAATTKHDRLLVTLDSYSHVYNNLIQHEYTRLIEEKKQPAEGLFGREKKPAIAWTRRLVSWIDKCDCNVLLICHQRDEWKDQKVVRQIFDGYEKLEYSLNLIMQLNKTGPKRQLKVVKSRFAQFPEGDVFDADYSVFAERLGRDTLEAPAKPLQLASAEQVSALVALIEAVKVDNETLSKWKEKAEVDCWSEMDAETIGKCLTHLTAKLPKSAT